MNTSISREELTLEHFPKTAVTTQAALLMETAVCTQPALNIGNFLKACFLTNSQINNHRTIPMQSQLISFQMRSITSFPKKT
jgi:hypothetical protein